MAASFNVLFCKSDIKEYLHEVRGPAMSLLQQKRHPSQNSTMALSQRPQRGINSQAAFIMESPHELAMMYSCPIPVDHLADSPQLIIFQNGKHTQKGGNKQHVAQDDKYKLCKIDQLHFGIMKVHPAIDTLLIFEVQGTDLILNIVTDLLFLCLFSCLLQSIARKGGTNNYRYYLAVEIVQPERSTTYALRPLATSHKLRMKRVA